MSKSEPSSDQRVEEPWLGAPAQADPHRGRQGAPVQYAAFEPKSIAQWRHDHSRPGPGHRVQEAAQFLMGRGRNPASLSTHIVYPPPLLSPLIQILGALGRRDNASLLVEAFQSDDFEVSSGYREWGKKASTASVPLAEQIKALAWSVTLYFTGLIWPCINEYFNLLGSKNI